MAKNAKNCGTNNKRGSNYQGTNKKSAVRDTE